VRIATTAAWTILSSRAAMPSGRCLPSALGMYLRRDGKARYAPPPILCQLPGALRCGSTAPIRLTGQCGRCTPETGPAGRPRRRVLWADAVEKVFLGWWTKFFRSAGASEARRGEGPHRPTRKRPQGFVPVLPRLAAAGTAENKLL
jgi:hypothetical protein